MDKFVKEGIIFSVVLAIIFLVLGSIDIPGFPMPIFSPYNVVYDNFGAMPLIDQGKLIPGNLVTGLVIAFAIGFGISYVKNAVMKK